MVIKVHGVDDLIRKVSNLGGINLKRGFYKAAAHVQKEAKKIAPVATPETSGYIGGTLRESISADANESEGRVFTNVEYAIYQEYGTSKMKAQPFLRPALGTSKKKINEILSDHINSELKKRVS